MTNAELLNYFADGNMSEEQRKDVCEMIHRILTNPRIKNATESKCPFLKEMSEKDLTTVLPSTETDSRREKTLYVCKIGEQETESSFEDELDEFKKQLKEEFSEISDDKFNINFKELEEGPKKFETYKFGNNIVSDKFGKLAYDCLWKMYDNRDKVKEYYVYVFWKKETINGKDESQCAIEFLEHPVYIGKGTGIRIFEHVKEDSFYENEKTSFKNREMRKLASEDNKHADLYVRKVVMNCSKSMYGLLEDAIIKLYDKKHLTNENDGSADITLNQKTRDSIATAVLRSSCEQESEEYKIRFYECKNESKCRKRIEWFTFEIKNEEFTVGCKHHFGKESDSYKMQHHQMIEVYDGIYAMVYRMAKSSDGRRR
uniref:PIR Superfamily Protein n=1 Tax=Rhabditophanes sp. KR3021 TaxID=114890 RepID=A0AC35UFJ4_9BILA